MGWWLDFELVSMCLQVCILWSKKTGWQWQMMRSWWQLWCNADNTTSIHPIPSSSANTMQHIFVLPTWCKHQFWQHHNANMIRCQQAGREGGVWYAKFEKKRMTMPKDDVSMIFWWCCNASDTRTIHPILSFLINTIKWLFMSPWTIKDETNTILMTI